MGLSAGSGAGDDLNFIPSRRLPSSPPPKFHHVKEHDSRICVTSLGALVKVSCSRGPERADGEHNHGTNTGAKLVVRNKK